MTWTSSRQNIRDCIGELGYAVYAVPPPSLDEKDRVAVLLNPPGRDSTRDMGGQVETNYQQRLLVLRQLGDQDSREVADAVDDAAEAITDKFHEHVVLEGAATGTEPISWDEASVGRYPPDGGPYYVQMLGLLDVSIIKNVDVGA